MAQPPGKDTRASPEARQHRSEHQDRGAHGLDQLVGCGELADRARVDLDAHLFADREVDAHAAQQLDHRGDVVQVRQVADGDRLVRQQRGREDRQRGVLGAGDAQLAVERRPPRISSLSMACRARPQAPRGLPLGRGEGLNIDRVDAARLAMAS
jgi:hypothetical protein